MRSESKVSVTGTEDANQVNDLHNKYKGKALCLHKSLRMNLHLRIIKFINNKLKENGIAIISIWSNRLTRECNPLEVKPVEVKNDNPDSCASEELLIGEISCSDPPEIDSAHVRLNIYQEEHLEKIKESICADLLASPLRIAKQALLQSASLQGYGYLFLNDKVVDAIVYLALTKTDSQIEMLYKILNINETDIKAIEGALPSNDTGERAIAVLSHFVMMGKSKFSDIDEQILLKALKSAGQNNTASQLASGIDNLKEGSRKFINQLLPARVKRRVNDRDSDYISDLSFRLTKSLIKNESIRLFEMLGFTEIEFKNKCEKFNCHLFFCIEAAIPDDYTTISLTRAYTHP